MGFGTYSVWEERSWLSYDLRNKLNPDGSLANLKACLAAKGYY